MHRPHILLTIAVAVLVLSAGTMQRASSEEQRRGVLRLLPSDAASDKTLQADGRALKYRAVAGTLPIFSTAGEQENRRPLSSILPIPLKAPILRAVR